MLRKHVSNTEHTGLHFLSPLTSVSMTVSLLVGETQSLVNLVSVNNAFYDSSISAVTEGAKNQCFHYGLHTQDHWLALYMKTNNVFFVSIPKPTK